MLLKRLTPTALALLALATAAPAQLTERDVKAVGKLMEEYFDPDASPGDQEEIKIELRESLEKIGKKLVEKGEDPLQGALALHADLGKALMLSSKHKKQRGGKVLSEPIEALGVEFATSVWIPKPYKVSEPATLVLCIPGLGDGEPMSPDQFLTEHWTDATVRDGALIAAIEMPADLGSWDQSESADGGPGGVYRVMTTLREMRLLFAVDPDRVYLAGRGEGVAAAMSLAAKFPHLFAGVIGHAGDVGEVGASNFRNLPTFLQGTGAQGTAFQEAAQGAGYENCTLQAEAGMADVWAWIGENVRHSNPAKVTLRPGAPIPNKAYWIQVPPTEATGITIEAEANRETNTITVTGEGVEAVTIFFNDALVDLSKPVKIVLNGREQEEVVPRSVDEMLSLIGRGTSDAGKLYVALRTYDLPG